MTLNCVWNTGENPIQTFGKKSFSIFGKFDILEIFSEEFINNLVGSVCTFAL